MIFLDANTFGIERGLFLNEPKIAYAIFSSLKTDKGNTPADSTAIDITLQKTIIKSYCEHMERRKLAINIGSSDVILAYNYISKDKERILAKNFSYGYNEEYGWNDTTGTAAGYDSSLVIRKAVYELIEKNEMLLFWYKDLGEYVAKDDRIKRMIQNMGFSSERVEVFSSMNLCNRYTFFTICICNNRIISSGVALDDDLERGLMLSLLEARLLEWQNKNNPKSNINQISSGEMQVMIDFIDDKIDRLNIFEKSILDKNFGIANWIKEIYVGLLNKENDYSPITVKCISKELFNCMPQKNYILDSKNKKILKEFDISEKEIKENFECILL